MEQLLSKGSRGPYVIWVREALRAGEMTNSFAYDYTFDADVDVLVRKYQDYKGLDADGIVGPKTWGALEAELEGYERRMTPTPLLDLARLGTVAYRNASIITNRVWHWFKAQGLPSWEDKDFWGDKLCSGIIASAYTESRLDASAINPDSSATGLFQIMASFWGLHPSKEERLDPWRNTDLILWGLTSIRASRRQAILQAAQMRRRPIESTMILFCRYVEAANDRETEMNWRRKLCRDLFGKEG